MFTTLLGGVLVAATLTIVPMSSSIASVVPVIALRGAEPASQDGCLSASFDDSDTTTAVLGAECLVPPGCLHVLTAQTDQDGFWRAPCDEAPPATLLL